MSKTQEALQEEQARASIGATRIGAANGARALLGSIGDMARSASQALQDEKARHEAQIQELLDCSPEEARELDQLRFSAQCRKYTGRPMEALDNNPDLRELIDYIQEGL